MRDQEATYESGGQDTPAGMISANTALRVILILLTIWTAFSGLALIFFPGSADATIAGGQGDAAKRLLGVHVLVLALVYGLLAWRRERYNNLLWVPYVVQTAVILVTLVNMIAGDSGVADGLLPLTVAGVFLALLVFVWRSGQLDVFPEPEVLSRFTKPDVGEEGVVELPPAVNVSSEPAPNDVAEGEVSAEGETDDGDD